MKQFWASFTGQLAGVLVQLALLGLAGWLLWRKFFGGKTVEAKVGEVVDAAATIPGGIVSLIGSMARGEKESTYISQAEARQRAAAALAAQRGQ